MRHFPANHRHGEFPDEDGKLDAKMKLLLNTTREVVLAILDGVDKVELKRYKKKIHWSHPPKKFPKKQDFVLDISTQYASLKPDETGI
jgi:hypothetical protein